MKFENFDTEFENKESIKIRLENIKYKYNENDKALEKLEEDSVIIKSELQELDFVKEILTQLKDVKMETKKSFILDTINLALKDIFNSNIMIDIETTSTTSDNKIVSKYDIILYQNGMEIAKNEKLLTNNGGGILSVISILFKIIVGYIYSNNKFYMFDESLSQVSADYRPRVSQFINKFCKLHGFTLVLVSHTEDLEEFADIVYNLDADDKPYKVSDTVYKDYISRLKDEDDIREANIILNSKDKENLIYLPSIKITSIKGNYPKTDFYYTKIMNFQSIEKLELRFKGFTIIRGRSNIGKSAGLRAIQSLLFNDFDIKDYPRKLRKPSAEVSVEFGFHVSEDIEDENKIKLIYDKNRVIYQFDGKDYVGKLAAIDMIKEKVESIGFKYVELKTAYKNFKGNVKDQTERLAYTNQHDGMYLVGNKSSEIEKVFNFLFDTYNISIAIVRVKEDIATLSNDYTEIVQSISSKKISKVFLQKEMEILENVYNIKCIREKLYLDNMKNNSTKLLNNLTESLNISTKKLIIIDSTIQTIELDIKRKEIDKNNIQEKLEVLEVLINQYTKKVLIKEYFNNMSLLNNLSINFEKITVLLQFIESICSNIDNNLWLSNNLNSLKALHDKYNYTYYEIDKYIERIHNKDNDIKINDKMIEVLGSIYNTTNLLSSIKKGIELNTKKYNTEYYLNNSILKLDTISNIDSYLNKLSFGLNVYNEQQNIITKNNDIIDIITLINANLDNLSNKYQLKICECCNGEGMVHI